MKIRLALLALALALPSGCTGGADDDDDDDGPEETPGEPVWDWVRSPSDTCTYEGLAATTADVGDLNGDGFGDFVIALYNGDHTAGGCNDATGRVEVFYGSAAGASNVASLVLEGAGSGDKFGLSIGSGDLNGDGFSDLLVGQDSPENSGVGAGQRGRSFAFLGGASGLSSSPSWTLNGEESDDIGEGILAGDFDGDGYDDVAVARVGYDISRGRIDVYRGGTSGVEVSPSRSIFGEQAVGYFGRGLAAGDANGDGFDDLLVSNTVFSLDTTMGMSQEGRVYLYAGSPAGLSSAAAWTATGTNPESILGVESDIGDVDGDGYDDIVVTESGFRSSEALYGEGAARLYRGSLTGPETTPSWTLEGGAYRAGLGWGLSVSDGNGDGFADVALTALEFDARERVFVIDGGASGLSSVPRFIVLGTEDTALFGSRIAVTSDVNGDGMSELLAMDPGDSLTEVRVRVWMYDAFAP